MRGVKRKWLPFLSGVLGVMLGTLAGEWLRTGFNVHGRAGFAIVVVSSAVGWLLFLGISLAREEVHDDRGTG